MKKERKHVRGCWDEGEPFEKDHVCSTELTVEDLEDAAPPVREEPEPAGEDDEDQDSGDEEDDS